MKPIPPVLAGLALALALAGPAPAAAAAEPRTLTLPEALRELAAHGPAAAQASARAGQASALVRQAAAPLLPTLAATGSYVRNSDELIFQKLDAASIRRLVLGQPVQPESIAMQPREAFSAAGTLRVPLVVPASWADLAAARHGAASARAGADAALLGLRLALVQGAWLAEGAEETAAAAERALANARDLAESAKRGVRAGLQPPLAALQAETQAVRRESDLVRARAAVEQTRLALGVLLGRAEPVRIALEAPAAPAASGPEALAAEALSRRPELRAQEELREVAGRQLTSARLRWLPQLSASGSAFVQDVPYPTGKREGWRVSVDLTWPLYDGGFRYGKQREAEALLAGAQAGAEAQRLAVLQEVEDATRDQRVSTERLRLAEKQRAVAADAAATARRGFDAGTTGHVEVLAAADELFQAEVGVADARARLGAAGAALDRAAGRL